MHTIKNNPKEGCGIWTMLAQIGPTRAKKYPQNHNTPALNDWD